MKVKILSLLVSTVLILITAFSLSGAGEMGGGSPGREKAFRVGLETNGFIVKNGTTYPVDTIADLLDSGLGDSANANNPGQPYKILAIPPPPHREGSAGRPFGIGFKHIQNPAGRGNRLRGSDPSAS